MEVRSGVGGKMLGGGERGGEGVGMVWWARGERGEGVGGDGWWMLCHRLECRNAIHYTTCFRLV